MLFYFINFIHARFSLVDLAFHMNHFTRLKKCARYFPHLRGFRFRFTYSKQDKEIFLPPKIDLM